MMIIDDEVEKSNVLCEWEEGCLAVIKIVKEKNKTRQMWKR